MDSELFCCTNLRVGLPAWIFVGDASCPTESWPVVVIFCEPKLGEIFVPAIAALAFTFELTIAPSRTTFTSAAPLANWTAVIVSLAIFEPVTTPLSIVKVVPLLLLTLWA